MENSIASRRKRLLDPEYRKNHLIKMSAALKGIQTFLGKQHSDKTKEQMSISHRGKHIGEKNSQYGTCWINDGTKALKISKDHLDDYLRKGYFKGRKLPL